MSSKTAIAFSDLYGRSSGKSKRLASNQNFSNSGRILASQQQEQRLQSLERERRDLQLRRLGLLRLEEERQQKPPTYTKEMASNLDQVQ